MRSKDLGANLRAIFTTFELHLKQQAVDLFVIFTVLVQPILIALLGIYLLRDEAASNAIYIVVGSGMTGLWSGLLFTSAFNIRGERWMGTLEMLVGSPTPLYVMVMGKPLPLCPLAEGRNAGQSSVDCGSLDPPILQEVALIFPEIDRGYGFRG